MLVTITFPVKTRRDGVVVEGWKKVPRNVDPCCHSWPAGPIPKGCQRVVRHGAELQLKRGCCEDAGIIFPRCAQRARQKIHSQRPSPMDDTKYMRPHKNAAWSIVVFFMWTQISAEVMSLVFAAAPSSKARNLLKLPSSILRSTVERRSGSHFPPPPKFGVRIFRDLPGTVEGRWVSPVCARP